MQSFLHWPTYVGVKLKEKIWSLHLMLNPNYIEFLLKLPETNIRHQLPTTTPTPKCTTLNKNTKT
jgi:hypothetical protein